MATGKEIFTGNCYLHVFNKFTKMDEMIVFTHLKKNKKKCKSDSWNQLTHTWLSCSVSQSSTR